MPNLGATVLMACTCQSDYQDNLHGPGIRVYNVGKKAYRCTVCGKEKMRDQPVPAGKPEEKK